MALQPKEISSRIDNIFYGYEIVSKGNDIKRDRMRVRKFKNERIPPDHHSVDALDPVKL